METKKFRMKICNCGTIHMIDDDLEMKAIKAEKQLVLICGNCGKGQVIGANKSIDIYEGNTCYDCFTFDLQVNHHDHQRIIEKEDFIKSKDHLRTITPRSIIYSKGWRVPMMTGMYATDYSYGNFSDRWYPDFYKIQRKDVTLEEVQKFISDWQIAHVSVNMARFITETPEWVLDIVSNYLIEGLDWSGTKYENKI